MSLPFADPNMQAMFRPDNFRLAPRFDADAQAAFIDSKSGTPAQARLDHALKHSQERGLPPISVRPLAGQHLAIVAQLMGAKTVLEVGTLGGYSALWLAAVAGAQVTTIEADAHHQEVAKENVAWGEPSDTTGSGSVDVIHGTAEDVMPALVKEGRQFDMVFIDANMENQDKQFDWAVQLTRPGGCVWLDDVVASMIKDGYGAEEEEEAKPGDTTPKEETVLDRIGRDGRVQATLVPLAVWHPMVPHSLFNGFILAIVKRH